MKILVINGTYRKRKTTTKLARKALEGAASMGAETEMLMLMDHDIQRCRNCLTCYKNLKAEIAPCPIKDDVTGILEKIRDADGVIFASPVHCGFVTGLMFSFYERAVWRLCRPTGNVLGLLKGAPEARLSSRARASASIVSAGGMPPYLRKLCDQATPWLRSNGSLLVNGSWVGDIYAGAIFNRKVRGDDWAKAYLYRELTEKQLDEAFALGSKMAGDVKKGRVRPHRYADEFGRAASIPLGLVERFLSFRNMRGNR